MKQASAIQCGKGVNHMASQSDSHAQGGGLPASSDLQPHKGNPAILLNTVQHESALLTSAVAERSLDFPHPSEYVARFTTLTPVLTASAACPFPLPTPFPLGIV